MLNGRLQALSLAAIASLGFAVWNVAAQAPNAQHGVGNIAPCPSPYHHDGDAIRCGGKGRSDRLYAIDAPEMPGACRPARQCTPGDPFAARDHLRALTAGKTVACEELDRDRYGRRILRCVTGGVDLSCAMVRDGFAVERYGRLRC